MTIRRTVDPTVSNDETQGFALLAEWLNTVMLSRFRADAVTAGAAMWTDITAGAPHDLGGASHNPDTLANLNSTVTDANLDDAGASRPAQAHALGSATHSADTLANLNSTVTDANMDDAGDARPPMAHTVASHSDTAATGPQLDTLVGGGNADSLHVHAGIGDVTGPASAIDDRVVAFDGTTGKLIKQGDKTVTAIGAHLDSTSNPHSVTAAQAGALALSGGALTGAVTTTSTFDGRNVSVDGSKLDGIEAGAKDDQSAAEVPFTPDGDIAATNAQAAIVEVRDDADTKLAGKASSTHATAHENGGGDEVNVGGLSGLLADPQTPAAHDLAGADHNSATLAALNAKVSDATLDDSGASRPPTAHNHAAVDVTSGTFADARVAQSNVTQHEAAIDHDALTNYAVGQHRVINDAGTSATELWSASKISTELASTGGADLWAALDANDATFPASNPAVANSRNAHPILAFDDTTAESVVFHEVMGNDYSAGNITVDIDWVAATATTGGVTWGVEFERIAPGGTDIDGDSFDTQQAGNSDTNATSGIVTRTSIVLTQAEADGISAGDAFRLRVQRVVSDGDDDMTGDAQILRVIGRQ